MLAGASGLASAAPPKKDPPLPPVDVRAWVVAPTADGPWTLRLENTGTSVIRVPADVRLLSLDVEVREKKRTKKLTCAVPSAMRPKVFPEARALFLQPGESYVETFDPHLLCFGKNAAALVPNALVRPRFGWKQPAWKKKHEPPYAAEENAKPATTMALREIKAPTMLLSYGLAEAPPPAKPLDAAPKAAASAPPPKGDATTTPKGNVPPPKGDATQAASPQAIVDVHAPALEVVPNEYVEAIAPRHATLRVKITNVGARPTHVVLRGRMLELLVDGPDGPRVCEAVPATGSVPRDNFRVLKPKQTTSLSLLLMEACAKKPLSRPGLYRVRPVLHAVETGRHVGLDAFTGVVPAKGHAFVRLATGEGPFYRDPPRATPKPPAPPNADVE